MDANKASVYKSMVCTLESRLINVQQIFLYAWFPGKRDRAHEQAMACLSELRKIRKQLRKEK